MYAIGARIFFQVSARKWKQHSKQKNLRLTMAAVSPRMAMPGPTVANASPRIFCSLSSRTYIFCAAIVGEIDAFILADGERSH